MASVSPRKSAGLARARLLQDQALQPLAEQRAQLSILASRLDRAARAVVTDHLSSRVRVDRRFGPVLGALMRMSLRA